MSGAHKLQQLHQHLRDQTRVIHLVRALDAAGWPQGAICALTKLKRPRVHRIVSREAWYWIKEDEEFYERVAVDLPWLRRWQRELQGVPSGANVLHKGQYADVDITAADNLAPRRLQVGG